jgi:UDP-N-acetylmuramoyl-L-alanyl-D-glutamate--2,6-diaminopimelate ligase
MTRALQPTIDSVVASVRLAGIDAQLRNHDTPANSAVDSPRSDGSLPFGFNSDPSVHHSVAPGSSVVTGATHDSRRVNEGTVFCCVPGEHVDGHTFAQAAVDAGARLLVVQRAVTTQPAVAQLQVNDVRAALGTVAAAAYGHPADRLVMVGITGTNGKTSTAHLLAAVLDAAGHPTEVIGTLTQTRTTPEATDLHERLASFVNRGITHVVMEVTSHSLVLGRVNGMHFRVAVFTNLSQDHLDFHGTMEEYFRAKSRLFEPSRADHAVVNEDDPHGRLLRDAAQIPTTTFGFQQTTDLHVGATSAFTLRGVKVDLSIGGRFSVSNALAAAEAARVLGIDDHTIAAGFAGVTVPGRFETISFGQPMAIVVDYAHTPDGLQRVLESARTMTPPGSRVICVFGCGGDRDRTKRPIMGSLAAMLSDLAIATSDNPRTEQPQAILDEIIAGVPSESLDHVHVEVDRRRAIRSSLQQAVAGDTVVIAGKGHEQGQDIGGVISPFDDRTVAIDELVDLGMITIEAGRLGIAQARKQGY